VTASDSLLEGGAAETVIGMPLTGAFAAGVYDAIVLQCRSTPPLQSFAEPRAGWGNAKKTEPRGRKGIRSHKSQQWPRHTGASLSV
jgi:hypothetical protein